MAQELRSRAVHAVKEKIKKTEKECADIGMAQDLLSFKGLTADALLLLGKNDIKTLDDLADLAGMSS